MGLVFFLYVYLFGGVTFIPLVIISFIYLHPKVQDDDLDEDSDHVVQDKTTPYNVLKATEIDELSKSGQGAYMSGWVTVTQEYIESMSEISSSTQSISETHESKSAYSSLYKLVKNSENGQGNGNSTVPTVSSNDTTFDNMEPASSTNASLTDEKKVKTSQKKHRFFAVLRHGNLFLYKNEKKSDVKHVIVLSGHVVAIWPRGLPEGQLFTKRTCLCILKKDYSRPRRLSEGKHSNDNESITTLDILNSKEDDLHRLDPPRGSFFLYCNTNIDKEDWYFALLRATKKIGDKEGNGNANIVGLGLGSSTGNGGASGTRSGTRSPFDKGLDPSIYAKSLHFKTADMIDLIQTLYSSEGQFQTKWLNAIIGRLFLALQKTETLKSYLQMKIEKKIAKINKPGFLDEFQIKKLDVGNSAPYFTYPSLKEISPDGTLVLSTNVHYHGALSIQIATKLFVHLGARFKPRDVDVLLSVTLMKLEGRLLIKIKPAPSERIWYTFESDPLVDLKIEPIVSSRQLTYNIITSTIEKKFKEAIKESLVFPHWDDFVFYDTEDEVYRGGIWDKSARPKPVSGTGEDLSSVLEEATKRLSSKNGKPDPDDASAQTSDSIESDIELTTSRSNGSGSGHSRSITTSSTSSAKLKLSSTLTEISKKIKKSKSSTTMSVNEENCLADGSMISPPPRSNTIAEGGEYDLDSPKKIGINTLRKIGKWYFKDGNQDEIAENLSHEQKDTYKPPEMISSRRQPRKSVTTGDMPETPTISVANDSIFSPPIMPSSNVSRKPSYEMFSKFPTADISMQSPNSLNTGSFDPIDLPPPQPFANIHHRRPSGTSLRSHESKEENRPMDFKFESDMKEVADPEVLFVDKRDTGDLSGNTNQIAQEEEHAAPVHTVKRRQPPQSLGPTPSPTPPDLPPRENTAGHVVDPKE
ncbi:nucleus-vacuole junction protein 2 [[Candida] railenensis]|uniref:Nucleus-vacuole junction protein 2 n=1 Tax=[Candida] railenensis TaxID=45579 RepID=A0A9P0QST6_9ASCO|nr:nucleus-vacuole junction protein 2 [[Candida] railenensis]